MLSIELAEEASWMASAASEAALEEELAVAKMWRKGLSLLIPRALETLSSFFSLSLLRNVNVPE